MTQIRPGTLSALLAVGICGGMQMAKAQQQNGSADLTAKEPVPAELRTKLDTKKAKAGDPVSAKTSAPTQLSNGVIVPKGAILTGKVSEVQSKSAGNGTASLEIVFDHIQAGKNGSPVAIHGILIGLAPKRNLSDSPADGSSLPTTMGSAQSSPTLEAELGYGNGSKSGTSGVQMGSSVRDVALSSAQGNSTPGKLTSSKKDIKLDGGTPIAVELESK